MQHALEGKAALVTGATSGIGAAIAVGLAGAGARVVVCGRRTTEGKQVVERIHGNGGKAQFIQLDVRDTSSVAQSVAGCVEAFGALDVAVNCAGISCPDTKLADIEDTDFDQMIAINLRGVWLSMKYELRQMLQQGYGSIINMSSILAHTAMGVPASYSSGHYVASKHGVEGLTKAAAMDYGRRGIRINSISPGIVETAFSEDLIAADVPVIRDYIARTALGRLAKVQDIVGAALFLASDASAYVTGTTIAVDGGYLAQ